jgi:hypothetical protein
MSYLCPRLINWLEVIVWPNLKLQSFRNYFVVFVVPCVVPVLNHLNTYVSQLSKPGLAIVLT